MVVSLTLRLECQHACDLKLCQIGTGMSQGDCNTEVDSMNRTRAKTTRPKFVLKD